MTNEIIDIAISPGQADPLKASAEHAAGRHWKSAFRNVKFAILASPLPFALSTAAALLFALCLPASAQQPVKIPAVAYLTQSFHSAMTEAFSHGLRELGYVQGKNIIIEWRYADGKRDRVVALAAELVRLNVDVIVSAGPGVTRIVKDATSTIPIVMAQDRDPVAVGLVASLSRPGGNITGLSTLSPELSGKRLEILTEIVPKLSRVAVLGSSSTLGYAQQLKELKLAAEVLRVNLQHIDVLGTKDIEPAFRTASEGRAQAMLVQISGPVASARREAIPELAVKYRLPALYEYPPHVEAGGLASYGVNLASLDRRAATYVDKILKGAKPAELPVEQPTKFEFIINLKAAKQIGLTIPPNVLARADKVIR